MDTKTFNSVDDLLLAIAMGGETLEERLMARWLLGERLTEEEPQQ